MDTVELMDIAKQFVECCVECCILCAPPVLNNFHHPCTTCMLDEMFLQNTVNPIMLAVPLFWEISGQTFFTKIMGLKDKRL